MELKDFRVIVNCQGREDGVGHEDWVITGSRGKEQEEVKQLELRRMRAGTRDGQEPGGIARDRDRSIKQKQKVWRY